MQRKLSDITPMGLPAEELLEGAINLTKHDDPKYMFWLFDYLIVVHRRMAEMDKQIAQLTRATLEHQQCLDNR